jgi:hypothetical protein
MTAQLTQTQEQQEEEPILWSIETHDLKEILTEIETYLQRLGDIDADWEWSSSIRRGIIAVLQTYCHVLQERKHHARQTTSLSYLKKKSEEPLVNPKMAVDDTINPEDSRPGHSSPL